MSENSDQHSDQLSPSDTRLYGWLELAVPLISFGGILIAFFFLSQGNILDIRIASAGCIIASFILAYLAWIRPKKDIVALTTPLYAVILFILPSELVPDLILPIHADAHRSLARPRAGRRRAVATFHMSDRFQRARPRLRRARRQLSNPPARREPP